MLVQIYEVATPEEAAALSRLGVDHIGVLVGDGAFPRELPAAQDFTPAMLHRLKLLVPEIAIMRAVAIVDETALDIARSYLGVADFLLCDSYDRATGQFGALGRTHDWRLSRRIVEEVGIPAILAGGLGPANVAAAIAAVRPTGVDSKTLTDRADGTGKDLDKVRQFVAAAAVTR